MHDVRVHVDDKGQFKSPISNFIFFCILLLFLSSEIHSQVDFMVYNGKNWNYSGNDICATYSSNNQGLALINAFSFFSYYDFTGALQNLWQKRLLLIPRGHRSLNFFWDTLRIAGIKAVAL